MNAAPLSLGVDIGGTKIALGLVDREGQVQVERRLPTLPETGAPAILDRIAQGIRDLLVQADRPVDGIGVGCPGYVNPHTGVCHRAVNLDWTDVPVRDELLRRLALDLPVAVHRDTSAGAVGEWMFGAGRGQRDFVYVAIGTGIGFGAVMDGRLLLGRGFQAMEFGHVSFDPQGRPCRCGLRGCAEAYASGVGLLAGFHEHRADFPSSALASIVAPTVSDILDAAGMGDALARSLLDEATGKLAAALACCVGVIDPGLFIVGGGLGLAFYDYLLPGLEEQVRARTLPVTHGHLRFARSQVTSSAAGAGALVWMDG
ncbi:MAG: ROK family protein [Chloroflexi bacterium]|nr:ROK family protein [Chloroflexota bacterium]